MGEARTLRVSARVPMRDLEERAVPREICGLQVHERPLRASRKRLPAVCAQVAGACFAGLPGNPSKQLSIPSLCTSHVPTPSRLPPPARACIVLHRAAPQPMRPREPREPDTAEDAGGQTDHSGQAYRGGLGKDTSFHKPPSFKSSLNPFIFSTLKSFFGRRVRSWLRTNAGGAPNTCKSRG